MEADGKFGYPTSAGGQFYNSPARYIHASVTDLIISPYFERTEGSNGLCAVYQAKCGQQPPPPPPKTMTLLELLSQPLPEIKMMDAATAAAPSMPAGKQSEPYVLNEHESHKNCAAKVPLGYIWLDKKWRENQGPQCIRQFMPVAGKNDVTREGQWMITTLMCIQRMDKNGHFWAYERLQVMDTELEDSRWLATWAEITHLKLT